MAKSPLSSRVRRLCAIVTLLMIVACSVPVWAQGAPTEAQLELNDSAVENTIEGKYARAVAQLEETVLRGEFKILYLNLGRAYQKLGKCKQARRALEKAKSAPAVEQPAAKLVNAKVEQNMGELAQSCDAESVSSTFSTSTACSCRAGCCVRA